MKDSIQLLTRFSNRFISPFNLMQNTSRAKRAMKKLLSGSGEGREFLGWIRLPSEIGEDHLQRIESTAQRIRSQSRYLVVVGIGGSYLGARAVLESIRDPFQAYSDSIQILYAGHHLSPHYHSRLLDFLKDKDFSVNVISKSGTTTEPAVAFRLLLDLLESKYGKEGTRERVVATTDASKGALKKLADSYGFETYVIPDDIGGRYSVLTPVGLLPISAGGGNIRELVNGARDMQQSLISNENPQSLEDNIALNYACVRNSLYQTERKIEIFVNYNPSFHYFAEWWKQLYGESEGKSHKGIFPASVDLTTDLHSLGQYIQDGERILFETVVQFQSSPSDLQLKEKEGDPDGLNYLSGKALSWVEEQAIRGTLVAHTDGGVPCIEILVPRLDEYYLGQLIYFFEFACGISGYMLGVNPFDQPGVEDYKNNMFALLGKAGFEKRKIELETLLGKTGSEHKAV